jgi:hypothetical protein
MTTFKVGDLVGVRHGAGLDSEEPLAFVQADGGSAENPGRDA